MHLARPTTTTHPRSARARRARALRPLAAGGALAAVLTIAAAAAASAHVPVTPTGTAAGASSTLTFKVPTESVTASTTTVVVHLPATAPFSEVSPQVVPGWTATVTDAALPAPVKVGGATLTKAPASVTWTAGPGGAIPPEQFALFTMTVNPLPTKGTELLLPVDQTYSDASVVHWDQETPASGKEPEHPAPSFTTTTAVATNDDGDPLPDAVAASAQTSTTGSDDTARWLAGAGLLLGAAALVLVLVLVRGRRPGSPA